MGKRFLNWLSKASNSSTRKHWKSRWLKFAKWVTTDENPLTGLPYMSCGVDEVDDVIRKDFEEMPSHLFQDHYKNILTRYVASLSDKKSNTALSLVSSVRSFFSNECVSIKLQKGKVPSAEMAENEHRFTLQELRSMWLVADTEGKARMSVAVSLGWGVGEILSLKTQFIKQAVKNVDEEGFAAFDYRRKKTKARIRGILNPNAVHDLEIYLKRVPSNQERLWTVKSDLGISKWLKRLCVEAGIENGTNRIRFHLIRKYVFDIVSSTCGVYESKLLTGKKIPLSDQTYLHNLEDRLLERYKKHAYPFLKLDGREGQEAKIPEEIKGKIKDLETTIKVLSQTTQLQDIQIKRLKEDKTVALERINGIEETVKTLKSALEKIINP